MIKHSLEDQLILHEGLRLEVYKCPADKWTIGVGRNLEAQGLYPAEELRILGTQGLSRGEVISRLKERGISREEAMDMLEADIEIAISDLFSFGWFENLDHVRKKVVVDMRFNLGPAGFRGFRKMIAALEVGDYFKAAEEMQDSQWYHQVGNRSKRLVRMMATGEDYEK